MSDPRVQKIVMGIPKWAYQKLLEEEGSGSGAPFKHKFNVGRTPGKTSRGWFCIWASSFSAGVSVLGWEIAWWKNPKAWRA